MFNYLVEENKLIPEFEKYNLSDVDREFITEQILGPSKDMKEKVNKICNKYQWFNDKISWSNSCNRNSHTSYLFF